MDDQERAELWEGDGREPDLTHAPWTEEEVDALNVWQSSPQCHPFTCPRRNDGRHEEIIGDDLGQLLATPDGWVCIECEYEQKWAFYYMLTPPPEEPWFKNMNPVVTDVVEDEAAAEEVADLEALLAHDPPEMILPFQTAPALNISMVHIGEEGKVRLIFEANGGDIDGRQFSIDLSEPMFYKMTIASVRLCRTFNDA